MIRGDDNYVPVAKFPKAKKTEIRRSAVAGSVGFQHGTGRKRTSIVDITDSIPTERKYQPKKVEEILTRNGDSRKISSDSDNRNHKKSAESDPPTPKAPPKIKKLPQITNFRTLKKQTIPERLKMGRCRTLS